MQLLRLQRSRTASGNVSVRFLCVLLSCLLAFMSFGSASAQQPAPTFTLCESLSSNSSGTLISHENFGSDNYPNNIDCLFTIVANGAPVTLTINGQVENEYDTVTISSGTSSNSFTASISEALEFTSGADVIIRFESDSSVRDAGFSISFTIGERDPIPSFCNVTDAITASEGQLQELSLGHNLHCEVTIVVPEGQVGVVRITSLSLESGFDFLHLLSGSESVSLTEAVSTFGVNGENIILNLTTDGSVSSGGFTLSFEVVPVNDSAHYICEESVILRNEGVLFSHRGFGSANYGNGLNCQLTLRVPPGATMNIDITDIDLEEGYDMLSIAYGSTSLSPSSTGMFISSVGDNVVFTFSSDGSVGYPGFRIEFSIATIVVPHVVCDSSDPITDDSGQVISHAAYGSSPHANNLDCSLSIVGREGQRVRITIQEFSLEPCCDHLTLTSGNRTDNSFSNGEVFFGEVGQDVNARFTSDFSFSSDGFVFSFEFVDDSSTFSICEVETIGSKSGLIVSHADYGTENSTYPNNQDCSVTIVPTSSEQVTIAILDFDLESFFDPLTVSAGAATTLISDTTTAANFTFTGPIGTSVTLRFRSDSSITYSGFLIEFTVGQSSAPQYDVCRDDVVEEAEGSIVSHQTYGSSSHGNNVDCNITIPVSDGYAAVVTVEAVQLETGFDFLTISDGASSANSDSFSNGFIFIGEGGADISIRFTADSSVTYDGFVLSYEVVDVTSLRYFVCGSAELPEAAGEIFSHEDFGTAAYTEEGTCQRTIAALGFFSAVTVTVDTLSLAAGDTLTASSGAVSTVLSQGDTFRGVLGQDVTLEFAVASDTSGGNGFRLTYQVEDVELDFVNICEQEYTNETEGYIGSHATVGSMSHENNQNCTITIPGVEGKVTILYFLLLELEFGFDFLTVTDDGAVIPVRTHQFIYGAPGADMVFRFTSDSSIARRGFLFSYEQVDLTTVRHSICQASPSVLSAYTGEIVSHAGYDGSSSSSYGNNLECSLTIEPVRDGIVTITVNAVDLDAGDTLSLGTASKTQFVTSDSVVFTFYPGESVDVTFVTGSSGVASGFLLTWDVEHADFSGSDICKIDDTITPSTPSGFITSQSNLNRPTGNGLSCATTAESTQDMVVLFRVIKLALDTGDSLVFTSGNRVVDDLSEGDVFFGEPSLSSSINFTTTQGSDAQGFIVAYSFVAATDVTHFLCSGPSFREDLIFARSGVIFSHEGYGMSNYGALSLCSVTIVVPENFIARLEISNFDVDASDTLVLSSGAMRQDTFDTSSGPVVFTGAAGTDVTVSFTSDYFLEGTGFEISFSVGDRPAYRGTVCEDSLVTSNYGVITSHDMDASATYPGDIDCAVTIAVPEDMVLQYTFTVLDIAESDNLAVQFGNTTLTSFYLGWTHYTLEAGEDTTISFVTDGAGSGAGFSLTYELVHYLEGVNFICNVSSSVIESGSGAIVSHEDYGSTPYANGLDCNVVLRVPINAIGTIYFSEYSVENGFDYVRLRSGAKDENSFAEGDVFEGAPGSPIVVTFHTDSSVAFSGFVLLFHISSVNRNLFQICDTAAVPEGITAGFIVSHEAYNLGTHANNLDCNITLPVPQGYAALIRVEFIDLESGFDVLTISYGGAIDTVHSTGDVLTAVGEEVVFQFTTDASVTNDGFLLSFELVDVNELSYPICEFSNINSQEALIVSHDGLNSTNYDNNVDCTMTITVPFSRAGRLTVRTFDVEEGFDTLTIAYGTTTTSTIREGQVITTNLGEDITLRFQSDGSVTYGGFSVFFELVDTNAETYVICETAATTSTTGLIYSHSTVGQDEHGNNLDCNITIPVADGFIAVVRVLTIDLEANFDFLTLSSGPSSVSSQTLETGSVFYGRANTDVFARFTADFSVSNDGFVLEYEVLPNRDVEHVLCASGGRDTLVAESGIIISHAGFNVSNYNNSLSCTLSIVVPSGRAARVRVAYLSLETGFDILQLSSGPVSVSSTSFAAPYVFTGTAGQDVKIEFSSDSSVTDAGFLLEFEVVDVDETVFDVCATNRTTAREATIVSHDKFGDDVHGNNLDCALTIAVPEGYLASFYVRVFSLEEGFDTLTVTSGAVVRTAFSAGMSFFGELGTDVVFEFQTDGSVVLDGFSIQYTLVSANITRASVCDNDLTLATSGEIVSHSTYDGATEYGNELDCSLTIRVPSTMYAVLTIEAINIEDPYDVLMIASGTKSVSSFTQSQVFAGDYGEDVVVSFSSDFSVTRPGFLISFEVLAIPGSDFYICKDMRISDESGRIHSHEEIGSSAHENNVDCNLTIAVPDNHLVIMTLSVLDLEAGYDFLYISYGAISQSSASFQEGAEIVTTPGADVVLRFTADASVTNGGFTVAYEIVQATGVSHVICTEDDIYSFAGVIQSHAGFGSVDYSNNQDCSVTIHVARGFVAIVVADSLELEGQFDLLRASSGTLSAVISTEGTRFVGQPGQNVDLRFTSDGSVAYAGFELTYEVVAANVTTLSICDVDVASDDSGEIVSHGDYGVAAHGHDLDCQIVIPAREGYFVVVTVEDIDLETNFDFLTMTSGTSTRNMFSNGDRFFGAVGTDVTLRLTTDASVANGGFLVSYAYTAANGGRFDVCQDTAIFSESGEIVSHADHGSSSYENDLNCVVTIHVPRGSYAVVRVESYSLEDGFDVLHVSSGAIAATSFTNGSVFEGEVGEDVVIRFTTDSSVTRGGFLLSFSVEESNAIVYDICGSSVAEADRGEIWSHDEFGSASHGNNLNCNITIPVPAGFVAVVAVEEFRLERGFDVLVLASGNIARDTFSAGDVFVGDLGADVYLQFTTDASVALSGFRLSYEVVNSTYARHDICDVNDVYSLSGEVVSHGGFGNDTHENDLDCMLVIHVPDGYFAALTADFVDLESGFDFLNVSTETTSVSVTSTGMVFTGGVGEDVTLHFTTDGSVTSDGFLLSFTLTDANITRTSICNLDGPVTGEGFLVSHEAYGSSPYGNNVECEVSFVVPATAVGRIRIVELDLESGFDFLTVSAGASVRNSWETSDEFFGGLGEDILISFTSDGSVTRGGFLIEFATVSPDINIYSVCSSNVVTATEAAITSHDAYGMAVHDHNLDCSLTIVVPAGSIGIVTVGVLDLEAGFDRLTMTSGAVSENSFVVGDRFFGEAGTNITIRFTTDFSIANDGFLLSYEAVSVANVRHAICTARDIFAAAGEIVSHEEYGEADYRNSMACMVTIHAGETDIVSVRIEEWEVESGFDRLRFSSGSSNAVMDPTSSLVYEGELGQDVVLRFTTDSSIVRAGFLLSFDVRTVMINRTHLCSGEDVYGTFGQIVSHEEYGMANHDHNLACMLTIHVPEGKVAVVRVEEFDLEEGYDFLTLATATRTQTISADVREFYGNVGEDVLLAFTSDASVSSGGFLLTYELVEGTSVRHDICEADTVYANEGEIVSHSEYGNATHGNNLNCALTIRVPRRSFVILQVLDFELERGYDVLRATSGLTSQRAWTTGDTFVGEVGRDVVLTFTSDGSISSGGFLLQYVVVASDVVVFDVCSTNTTSEERGEIVSHEEYDGSTAHGHNLDCSLTVTVSEEFIAVVTVEEFDLEEGYDILTISSGETSVSSGSRAFARGVLFFGEPGEDVVVSFTSDESVSQAGFRLTYEIVSIEAAVHDVCAASHVYAREGQVVSHDSASNDTHMNNLDCSLTIHVPFGYVANVSVVHYDVEEPFDTLTLRSGVRASSSFSVGDAFVGAVGTNVVVEFTSDGSIAYTGFVLDFVVVPAAIDEFEVCAHDTIGAQSGVVVSHAGAGASEHGDNVDCTSTLSVEENELAIITINFVDLEEGYDVLEISSGEFSRDSFSEGERYVFNAGEDVTFHFTADESISNLGFSVSFAVIPADDFVSTTSTTTTTTTAATTSGNTGGSTDATTSTTTSVYTTSAPATTTTVTTTMYDAADICSVGMFDGSSGPQYVSGRTTGSAVDCSAVIRAGAGERVVVRIVTFELDGGTDMVTVVSGASNSLGEGSAGRWFYGTRGEDVTLQFTSSAGASAGNLFVAEYVVVAIDEGVVDMCEYARSGEPLLAGASGMFSAFNPFQDSKVECVLVVEVPEGSVGVFTASAVPAAATFTATVGTRAVAVEAGSVVTSEIGQEVAFNLRYTSSSATVALLVSYSVEMGFDSPPSILASAVTVRVSPEATAGSMLASFSVATNVESSNDYSLEFTASSDISSSLMLSDDVLVLSSSAGLSSGSYVVIVTASDSRSECRVYNDETGTASVQDGPCSASVEIAVFVPELGSCGDDHFYALGAAETVRVTFATPSLVFPVPGVDVESDVVSPAMLGAGVTTVTFTAAVDVGPALTCSLDVVVMRGTEVVVDKVSTSWTESIVSSLFVDATSGRVETLTPFSFGDEDSEFVLQFLSEADSPFYLDHYTRAGSDPLPTRLYADLRYCASGVSFPDLTDSGSFVVVDTLDVSVSLLGSTVELTIAVESADILHASNPNAGLDESCFRIAVTSEPIPRPFSFEGISIVSSVPAPARRRRDTMSSFTLEPKALSYAGAFMQEADGSDFVDSGAKNAKPLSLQDVEPPVIANCPSAPIEVGVSASATTFQATLPALEVTDNRGVVMIEGPYEGGVTTFSVLGSPHQVTVVASDSFSRVYCRYFVIARAPSNAVSTTIATSITRSTSEIPALRRVVDSYNLIPSTPAVLEDVNLSALNELRINFETPAEMPVFVRDVNTTQQALLYYSMRMTAGGAFSSAATLDGSSARLELSFLDTAGETMYVDTSEAVISISLQTSAGASRIQVTGDYVLEESLSFSSVSFRVIYINDGTLPADVVTWTMHGTSFFGLQYSYDSVNNERMTSRYPVAFYDATVPVVTCPADQEVPLSGRALYETVSWSDPVVSDSGNAESELRVFVSEGFGGNSKRIELSDPSSQGTAITYTAIDPFGNTGTCTFYIRVIDTQDPTAACPDSVMLSVGASESTARLSESEWFGFVSVSDNAESLFPVVLVSPAPSTEFSVGDQSVSVVVADGYDNRATCMTRVVVVDAVAPSVYCPSDVSFGFVRASVVGRDETSVVAAYNDNNQYYAYSVRASATDNVGVRAIELTTTNQAQLMLVDGEATVLFPVGATTLVRVYAIDTSENTDMCAFTVSIDEDPTTSSSSNGSTSLNSGTIAAIAVVAVLLVIIVVLIVRHRASKNVSFDESAIHSYENPVYGENSSAPYGNSIDNPMYDSATPFTQPHFNSSFQDAEYSGTTGSGHLRLQYDDDDEDGGYMDVDEKPHIILDLRTSDM